MNSFIWLHNYRKSFIWLYDFMNIFIWLYDHIWWWPCVGGMQTPPCSWDETIAPSTVLPFMPIISKPITHASSSQWQGYKYTYLYLYVYYNWYTTYKIQYIDVNHIKAYHARKQLTVTWIQMYHIIIQWIYHEITLE